MPGHLGARTQKYVTGFTWYDHRNEAKRFLAGTQKAVSPSLTGNHYITGRHRQGRINLVSLVQTFARKKNPCFMAMRINVRVDSLPRLDVPRHDDRVLGL